MTAARVRRWAPLFCFLAAALVFFSISRPAYRGYFSEDDMATMSWAPIAGADTYYGEILSLRVSALNFRPFATLYYRILGRTAKLRYPPYVAVLQMLHILNTVLLILLLRALGFESMAAGIGALFYAFHFATFEAYFKPMFVFDLLCGTLCLAAFLLYIRGRWLVALAA